MFIFETKVKATQKLKKNSNLVFSIQWTVAMFGTVIGIILMKRFREMSALMVSQINIGIRFNKILDALKNNCRDFNALVLSIINPSKLADGLDALESVNAFVLTIRHLLESKATLVQIVTAGMIGGYFSVYMIIHG